MPSLRSGLFAEILDIREQMLEAKVDSKGEKVRKKPQKLSLLRCVTPYVLLYPSPVQRR